MICIQRRPECWTSQGSLSCSTWKSACHDWTATDATHNTMPECKDILVVTTSWLISVCGFCLCGIRSWKSHVWWYLGMKELLNLLQRFWVGKAGPIPWRGGHVSVPYQTFSEVMSQNTFVFNHLAFWQKDKLKLNMIWDLLSSGIVSSIKW